MNISCICIILSSAVFKQLSQDQRVSIVEAMLWRNVICTALVSAVFLWPNRVNPFAKSEIKGRGWWIAFRVFWGTLMFSMTFYVITRIPIYLMQMITRISPLWVSILGYFINGEVPLNSEYIAMAICFSLVVMISLNSSDGVG